eukprot:980095-Pyramimonas_sp.AAC.2
MAHTLEAVQAMAQDFTDILVSMSMQWKPASLQYLNTCRGTGGMELWQHGRPLTVQLVQQMEVLGTLITSSGDSLPA